MNDMEIERFREVLHAQIVEHEAREEKTTQRIIDAHNRSSEHIFLQEWMKKEKRRQEIWDKVKGNLIFWIFAGIAGTIGIALWHQFVGEIRKG